MKPDILLGAARRAWADCADMRSRRARMKAYTYGRQWSDALRMPDGTVITEGEYARRCGAHPATNNLLRQLVKNVIGRFRARLDDEEATSPAVTRIRRRNHLNELDARALEEFLISGCAVQRVARESRPDGMAVWVDNVSPERFFVNRHSDPRGHDIDLVGMLHDMTLAELLVRFGGDDAERHAAIAQAYRTPGINGTDAFGAAARPGRCRVVEVWSLDAQRSLEAHDPATGRLLSYSADTEAACIEDMRRRGVKVCPRVEVGWRGRWYTPDGMLLHTVEAPYHPFVVKLYPLIDGEVHSFVEDVVDQQRHINRLITLMDHIMATSAKNTLLFPHHAKPESMSWDEIRDTWAQPGGMIIYDSLASNGVKPEPITSPGGDAGASSLLAIEMKLIEQISGVSTALQGRSTGDAHASAQLYEAQSANAMTALRDIFDTFDDFRHRRDALAASL